MTKPILDRILVKRVRRDGGSQPRVEMDLALIDEYAEVVEQLPPIDVVFDGKVYWVYDGHHRVCAHEKAGRKEILANIVRGERRDAVLLSLGVNAAHGLRRTNADKRRAVETMLKDPEWSQWSDRKIADHCAVDHRTVGHHRQALASDNKGQTGVGEIPHSALSLLPEEWADVYDALTPEQKLRYEEDQKADMKREQAKQDAASWLERVETWAARGVELFRARPEIAARDLKAVGQRIETVLKTARKYEW